MVPPDLSSERDRDNLEWVFVDDSSGVVAGSAFPGDTVSVEDGQVSGDSVGQLSVVGFEPCAGTGVGGVVVDLGGDRWKRCVVPVVVGAPELFLGVGELSRLGKVVDDAEDPEIAAPVIRNRTLVTDEDGHGGRLSGVELAPPA
jgi:hypothetical protein